jgi:hypothetical protein
LLFCLLYFFFGHWQKPSKPALLSFVLRNVVAQNEYDRSTSPNAEITALDLARANAAMPKLRALRLFRIAAEDTVDGLAQRSAVDLGQGFITMLYRSGRNATDRLLSQDPDVTVSARREQQAHKDKFSAFEFQPTPMETA